MTTPTIIDATDFWWDFIERFNQQYDDMPTALVHIPLSEAELSEMSYYDALGRYCTVDPDET